MRPGWVWAPKARRVELTLYGATRPRTIALKRRDGGLWGDDRELEPGTRYGFSLDGGPVLPDPRAQFQPLGLPGPSEVIDHAAFAWSKAPYRPASLARAVFYELHVGTFSARGDYRGVMERLDHLRRLGVTHLELMPVHQFPGRHGWGYDGVQPFAPFHAYGRPEELKQLIDSCHALGIAVVLDVVYNHVGPDQNTLPKFGPYLHRGTDTPWGHGYNLDGPHSTQVRRFILDNVRMWLHDYRFDGVRLDAVQSIVDSSSPHLLDEISAQAHALSRRTKRPAWVFAEAERRRPQLTASRTEGGHQLDAQWDDDLHYSLLGTLRSDRAGHYRRVRGIAKLGAALAGQALRPAVGPQKERSVPPDRLITYLQNHDRVGNRPDGQRFAVLGGQALDRLGALLMFTSAARPLLFMGQEWGATTPFYYFVDHQRPGLVRSVRRGRAREMLSFGWKAPCPIHPDERRAFTASQLDWSELDHPTHEAALKYYTSLIRLRKRFSELTEPASVAVDEGAETLSVRRKRTRVFANLSKETRRFSTDPGSRILLASSAGVTLRSRSAELAPFTACLLLRGQPGQGPRAGAKRRRRS